MSGQVPKLELKYWKLRARKFTLNKNNFDLNYLKRILTIRVNFIQREFPIIRYKNRHGSRNEFTQAEVQELMTSGDQNSDIGQKLDEVHEPNWLSMREN